MTRSPVLSSWLFMVMALVSLFLVPPHSTHAFTISGCSPPPFSSRTCLYGKGFRGAKNKQAALAKKLELAKKQQQKDTTSSSSNDDDKDGEIDGLVEEATQQEKNTEEEDAHAEFAKLLAKSPPPKTTSSPAGNVNCSIKTSNYDLTKQMNALKKQKKQQDFKHQKQKAKSGKKNSSSKQSAEEDDEEYFEANIVLEVGDKARRYDFESLLDASSGMPLGPIQAATLVPWVPPYLMEYMLIVADPRRQSNDLRQCVQYLLQSTTSITKGTIVAINTDESLKDTQSWMQRNDISNNINVHVLSDKSSSLEWMTTYSCCTNPWSTHLLLIDNNGCIQNNIEEVKPSQICQIVTDLIKPYEGE